MATRNSNRKWWQWSAAIAGVLVLTLVAVMFFTDTDINAINDKINPPPTVKIDDKVIGKDDTGAKITATSQAAPRDLKAEPIKLPKKLQPPMSPFDEDKPNKWHVTSISPSGKLKAPLQVTLPLDHAVSKGEYVHIAVNHSHKANGWTLLDLNKVKKLKTGDRYVTFEVNELSWFAPFFSDIGNMVNELKTQFIDGMTSNVFANAKQPECASQDKAREANHEFNSSGQDAILWCAGYEKIKGEYQRVIKMTNNRTAPEIIDPSWLNIHSRGHADLNLSQILNQGDKVILKGTDTAVFSFKELKLDQNVTLTADTSMQALGLQAVDLIVKTIISIVLKTDASAAIDKAAKVKELVELVLHQRDCVGALGDITNLGNFIKECFTTEIFQIAFDGKWWTTLLVPVMTAFSFISLGKGVVETIRDMGNGRAKYSITASRPKPNPYASILLPNGEPWHVHGYDIWIKSDGTATSKKEAGPCDINEDFNNPGPHCDEHMTYSLKPIGNGTFRVTVTGKWHTTDSGEPYDYTGDPGRGIGDTLVINRSSEDPHLLDWVWDDAANNGISAKLCDPYAAQRNDTKQYQLCGA